MQAFQVHLLIVVCKIFPARLLAYTYVLSCVRLLVHTFPCLLSLSHSRSLIVYVQWMCYECISFRLFISLLYVSYVPFMILALNNLYQGRFLGACDK